MKASLTIEGAIGLKSQVPLLELQKFNVPRFSFFNRHRSQFFFRSSYFKLIRFVGFWRIEDNWGRKSFQAVREAIKRDCLKNLRSFSRPSANLLSFSTSIRNNYFLQTMTDFTDLPRKQNSFSADDKTLHFAPKSVSSSSLIFSSTHINEKFSAQWSSFPSIFSYRYRQFERALHKFQPKRVRNSFRKNLSPFFVFRWAWSVGGKLFFPHMIHKHAILIRRLTTESLWEMNYRWNLSHQVSSQAKFSGFPRFLTSFRPHVNEAVRNCKEIGDRAGCL